MQEDTLLQENIVYIEKNSEKYKVIIQSTGNSYEIRFILPQQPFYRIILERQQDNWHFKCIEKCQNNNNITEMTKIDTNVLQQVFCDEKNFKAFSKALQGEKTLCRILLNNKIITQQQYSQIIQNNIEQEQSINDKESLYTCFGLPNAFCGRNTSNDRYGCLVLIVVNHFIHQHLF